MQKFLVVVAFLSLFACSVGRSQDNEDHAGAMGHVVVKAGTVKWGPAPNLPPGAEVGVLVGDPRKPGVPYVLRVKMPDGYKVPAHWHSTDENVTVLRGTLRIGKGETFDPAKLVDLPAGSFMRMPKTMRHFGMTKGETILQVHGIGPFEFNYVNAADDPLKKDSKK